MTIKSAAWTLLLLLVLLLAPLPSALAQDCAGPSESIVPSFSNSNGQLRIQGVAYLDTDQRVTSQVFTLSINPSSRQT
ncbi:MAG: hypothetical protein ACREDO_08145 [Methyloceanibacter sp.]